jgi:cytoskeletal protein RodZ
MNKKTFGQNLKNIREEKKLNIEFCSSSLKIHRKYLEGIENDDYKVFTSYHQALGFVQNYLEFLDLKVDELTRKWRSEFYENFDHKEKSYTRYYKPKKKIMVNLNMSLSKVIYIFSGIIVLSFFSYIGFSFSQTLSNPVLDIYNPKNNDVVEEDLIDINGKTDSDSVLKINNEKIVIQTDGSFSTSLKLSEGINTFKFSSLNPYGKETVKILTVIYRPRKIEIYNPPLEETLTPKDPSELSKPEMTIPAKTLTTPKQTITISEKELKKEE